MSAGGPGDGSERSGDAGAASEPVDPSAQEGERRGWAGETKGMDEHSAVLGMTPREHERRMRKWYILLAVAALLSVFGEGMLLLTARRKDGSAPPAAAPTPAAQSLPPRAGPSTP